MVIEMTHATLMVVSNIMANRNLAKTRKSLAANVPTTLWNMRARAIRENANLCRMRGGFLAVLTDEQLETDADYIDLVIGSAIDGEWFLSACAAAEEISFIG